MIILIGGVSCIGKTWMAQKLLETYNYPYLSIDLLKMGLYRSTIDCGFTPNDSIEHSSECLWPILKGIIMTAIENHQHLIIEGIYLLPNKIAELDDYKKEIISFYLVFSESYIKKYYDTKIIQHRNIIETRKYENHTTLTQYLAENMYQKNIYKEYHSQYFEIQEDYEKEIQTVYHWLSTKL